MTRLHRRHVLRACAVAGLGVCSPALAKAGGSVSIFEIATRLLRARAGQVGRADFVGLTDFAAPSWRPRFHLVDMKTGAVSSLLVAHGRGSDPSHTGWLASFSNEPGSNATSKGAYRTEGIYDGKYGRSMRLVGLDTENSNAEARAIVIHPAWYVGEEMLAKYGKLGRSEGCFAVSRSDLSEVLDRLDGGCLVFAGKY